MRKADREKEKVVTDWVVGAKGSHSRGSRAERERERERAMHRNVEKSTWVKNGGKCEWPNQSISHDVVFGEEPIVILRTR